MSLFLFVVCSYLVNLNTGTGATLFPKILFNHIAKRKTQETKVLERNFTTEGTFLHSIIYSQRGIV